jgi:AcrR family transcriptional regulator
MVAIVRDKQREETRRRLYLAALQIFRRDGVHNCRIDDIAKIAEVSRAAFYFHFPTKEDVLIELLRESEKPISECIAALKADTPVDAVVEATADALARFWEHEPLLLPEVATVALRMNAVVNDREAEPVRAILSQHFTAASARHELSPVLPPEVLADFFLANCLAAMMAWCANPLLPLQQVLRGVAYLFLNGARGTKGPKSP